MWNSNLNKINAKSQHLNLLMMGGDFGEISGKNHGEIFRWISFKVSDVACTPQLYKRMQNTKI